ncbi:ABC transporter permease [Thalassotalea sp. LPB0316]|uniref:ABC transporter permease n=1 Tax=Thalassotalea sp. LPB0316 TaxID=2769490 RepID=UPI0018688BD4|nr:ABC transporter permease [Thalassotalea sp. LPB0316]QOL25941.1 ABC transporter permease [Thalassotalea sp. LPB0316]
MLNQQWRKTWLVASWEFMHFFKWKQEIISKLIMLAVGVVVFLWQTVKHDYTEEYRVAVKPLSSFALTHEKFSFTALQSDLAELTQALKDERWDAIVVEQSKQEVMPKLLILSRDKHSWLNDLHAVLREHYKEQYSQTLGLNNEQLEAIRQGADIDIEYLDESVKTQESSNETIALGMLIMIGVGVFTCFGQLFVSVTGEKQQRVTEQLYSCISPQTWVDGKILGQVLHAIKAMASVVITILLVMAFTSVVLNNTSVDFSFIDWRLLPWLVVFAVTGVYFCTCIMAAIAAAIDDPNHSGKSAMMLLPLLPLLLTFITLESPSGWALTFLSLFPLTAFAAMPVKMSLIDVPIWQPIIALSLTLLTCFYIRTAAARLFKMCMTMYGKEPKLLDMLKWFVKDPS